jgi:hypothetical protein
MDRRRIIMGICTTLQKRRFSISNKTNTLFSSISVSCIGANPNSNAGVFLSSSSLSPIFSRVCCENNWNSNNPKRWKSESKPKSSDSTSSTATAAAKHKKRKESLDSFGTWDSATDLPLQVRNIMNYYIMQRIKVIHFVCM